MTDLRARRVMAEDFARFDLVLAMDRSNLRDLQAMRPATGGAELALFLQHTLGRHADVPDPYYTGTFAQVFDLIDDGVRALVTRAG